MSEEQDRSEAAAFKRMDEAERERFRYFLGSFLPEDYVRRLMKARQRKMKAARKEKKKAGAMHSQIEVDNEYIDDEATVALATLGKIFIGEVVARAIAISERAGEKLPVQPHFIALAVSQLQKENKVIGIEHHRLR